MPSEPSKAGKPCDALTFPQLCALEYDNIKFGKTFIQLDVGLVSLGEAGQPGIEINALDFKKICEWYLGELTNAQR